MGIILVMKAFLQRKGRLSDIEFLAIKEFGGKIVSNEGTVTTTGDLATLTANSGKDMYLAKAKVSVMPNTLATGISPYLVELKINGTTVESFNGVMEADTGVDYAEQGNPQYEFINIGRKVAATQIIKLEVITNTGNDQTFEGSILCFEEATGDSPQI